MKHFICVDAVWEDGSVSKTIVNMDDIRFIAEGIHEGVSSVAIVFRGCGDTQNLKIKNTLEEILKEMAKS